MFKISRTFYKPIIVVSKCLGFEACKYNGQIEKDLFIDKLQQYVQIKTVCPEVSIDKGSNCTKGKGIFAASVLNQFPFLLNFTVTITLIFFKQKNLCKPTEIFLAFLAVI